MVASGIIFFLLFLLPFVIAPFGITQFEDPKVVLAEGAIILLLLVTLFSSSITLRWATKQVLLFVCIIVLTIIDLFFFKTSVSLFGNQFRMQGIFLLWLLLLFSFLSAHVSLPLKIQTGNFSPVRRNRSDIEQNIRRFFSKAGGWFFTFLLLAELVAMSFLPLNGSQRYVGTLGEPNALGAFAIFLWPFGWFAFTESRRGHWGKTLLLFIVGSILLLTDSRSAMVAFVIQLLFISFRRFRLSFAKAAAVCFFLFVLSYTLPFFQNDPYENRVQVWTSAFYAGMINPGIGQGFGNVEVALRNSSAGLALPIEYYYVDSSHNIFLDWWVAGGILGLGILLYIVYLASKKFIHDQDGQMFVLLIGLLTVLSFNPASVVGLLGFWWIIGRGFATKN